MNQLKIVFMGTATFSEAVLKNLIQHDYNIVQVVSQPDRRVGRKKELKMPEVKVVALKHDIPVFQPQRIKEDYQAILDMQPDLIITAAYGQMIPQEVLDCPRLGCINVHASLLPKYRGASPIQWAVIDGCEYSGVTTMKMDEGLDTGDILLVDKVKLDKKETGGSLFDRLSIVGAKLLIKTLEGLETGSIIPEKQNEAESSYVKMLKKSMGELDFTKSARQIECLIRGLNPWPSAFTHLNGKMLKIWDADVVNDSDDIINNNNVSKECEAGTVCYVDKKTFIIKCGKDYLKVNELQLEGKKRMSTDAFLLGSHVEEGTALG